MQHDMKDLFARALVDEPPASVDVDRAVAHGRRQRRLVVGGRAALGAAAAGVAALTIGVLAPALSTQGNDVAVSAPDAVASAPAQDPLAGGTGTAAPTEDRLANSDLSGVSPAQAAEIADREVTVQEYRAAYARYRECMRAGGYDLPARPALDRGVHDFSIPVAAEKVDAACSELEYRYTDTLWQTSPEIEDQSLATQLLRECLQKRGIEPRKSSVEINKQVREVGIDLGECLTPQ